MAQTGGLWMLLAVAALLVLTGLPAWIVLIGVSVIATAIGTACGVFDLGLLTALPLRLVGLLDNDLLQALPLYALMGVLLNRLALADIWLRASRRLLRRTGSASELSALTLGMLTAPMNGSVGASVAMLGRTVLPQLEEKLGSERGAALACVASTLGIVVPPSLVLVLLGDAMMRAHTEAANATGALVRIINTQDVFHAALLPASLFFVLALLLTAWRGRGREHIEAAPAPVLREWIIAAVTAGFVLTLLFLVASGRLYAVEAAASGGVALFLFAVFFGGMRRALLAEVLRDTLALTGALFALLVGATTFTLLVRSFGTDRWVADLFAGMGGGEALPLLTAMATLVVSALVLDAFEIIFVVIPVVMPPLLMRVPDATWVAVLTLLVLQLSFLMPPLGYSLLMVRGYVKNAVHTRFLAKALLPYLLVQVLVLALVLGFPRIVSSGVESREEPAAAQDASGDGGDLAAQLRRQQADQ
jgi:TRAP-type mannitol/chloroaromatic compound transport system permease large subunit